MFEIGKATNVGIKRRDHPNQDTIGLVVPGLFNWRPPLMVVADGMGGYEGGSIASQVVVDTLIQDYKQSKGNDYSQLLRTMILHSHDAIKKRVVNDAEIQKMGSTVVAAILDKNDVYIGNVGDSRAYLINSQEVKQLSWDHSFVGELVRQGAITSEEGLLHPKRNILTMSITAQRPDIDPYVGKYLLSPNDCVLLCSDGLWGSVKIEKIHQIVMGNNPQSAAEKLIDNANANMGPDNISVMIAKLK